MFILFFGLSGVWCWPMSSPAGLLVAWLRQVQRAPGGGEASPVVRVYLVLWHNRGGSSGGKCVSNAYYALCQVL